jgi:hypothetical protein
MKVVDRIIKLVSALGGVIGTALGVYNVRAARKKGAREAVEHRQQAEDHNMYEGMRARMQQSGGEALIAGPTSDPELFLRAERMVRQGLLERGLGGHPYTLPRADKLRSQEYAD